MRSARSVRRRPTAALSFGLLAFAAGACAPDPGPRAPWALALDALACGPEIEVLVKAWGARGVARPASPVGQGEGRFRIPTAELGVWVEIASIDGAVTGAALHRGGIVEVVDVDATSCDTSERAIPALTADPRAGRDADGPGPFTDEDLTRAVGDAARTPALRGVAVYVWSPHMPLSVDGLPEIARAAAEHGFRFEPVLFPGGDRDFADREAERVGAPPEASREAASSELAFRDALVHAPTLILYGQGRAGPVLPGYRDAEGYGRFIEDWLTRR